MNLRASLTATLMLSIVTFLSACDTTGSPGAGVTRIISTTSFGMCMGYCRTQLEITPVKAVLVREPGGRGAPTLPVQRFERPLAPGEWQSLAQSAASARFAGLPETIGCPDCADGGAESLSVTDARGTKAVNFDHGKDVTELQPLLNQVRDIRASLTPKE